MTTNTHIDMLMKAIERTAFWFTVLVAAPVLVYLVFVIVSR
jgi:hypothetical protein